MKAKSKIWIFVAVLIAIVSLIGTGIFFKVRYKKRVKEHISTLDSLRYLSLDGSVREITPSQNAKVIFFFNTECEHCQAESRLISENAASFQNSDIYFFSTEELPAIASFAYNFGLTKSNFNVGRVDFNQVILKMDVFTYPMCFIYSKEGKLLKNYIGEVKPEAITKYLQ